MLNFNFQHSMDIPNTSNIVQLLACDRWHARHATLRDSWDLFKKKHGFDSGAKRVGGLIAWQAPVDPWPRDEKKCGKMEISMAFSYCPYYNGGSAYISQYTICFIFYIIR